MRRVQTATESADERRAVRRVERNARERAGGAAGGRQDRIERQGKRWCRRDSGSATRSAGAAVQLSRGLAVAVAAGALVRRALMLVLSAVLVMPERHALRLANRSDALHRNGHGQ